MTRSLRLWMALACGALLGGPVAAGPAHRQHASAHEDTSEIRIDLPKVTVTAPPYQAEHAGYVVSGDFKVLAKLPYMVYPAQPLGRGDVISVNPLNLQDNEYLVLQECVSARCDTARIVRLWSAHGSTAHSAHAPWRMRIPGDGKYFLYLKQLPSVPFAPCDACTDFFASFRQFGPPLTLTPTGATTAFYGKALDKAAQAPPEKIVGKTHEGATFVATFASGSKVRLQRMRPDDTHE